MDANATASIDEVLLNFGFSRVRHQPCVAIIDSEKFPVAPFSFVTLLDGADLAGIAHVCGSQQGQKRVIHFHYQRFPKALCSKVAKMRYQLNDRDVVSEILDGEAIVIHLQSGAYYSMLASGAEIWNGLLAGYSVEEIANWLARSVPGERMRIGDEVAKFASELVSEGLIIEMDADMVSHLNDLEPAGVFETPELQKYTDMQELLLVDPIHEVTEAGWPLRDTTGT